MFAGLRPLATASAHTSTEELPRDHKLVVNASGLITITGGKWTTYRKMAKETVDTAVKVASLKALESPTTRVRIHGFKNPVNDRLSIYGSDADEIRKLMEVDNELKRSLVNGHLYPKAEVVWALRNEMARTVEDVLARRLRLLFLDAEAALKAAPVVAALIASELHVGREKIQKQLDDFADIAAQYILKT